jgi:hypothetical protein
MYSNLTNNKKNYQFNCYLLKCDLINKYNIKSIKSIPTLKKIVLDFSFKEFLNNSSLLKQTDNSAKLQIRFYLIFYMLSGLLPFIYFNKFSKNSENFFSLKIEISKQSEMYMFLLFLFIENWTKLIIEKENFSLFKKSTQNKLYQKSFILNTNIPLQLFFEKENDLNKILPKINYKNLNVKLNFFFDLEKLKMSNTFIKNFPFFWKDTSNV